MRAKDEVAVFPITGWNIGPLPEQGAILMQFDFITSTLHSVDESLETNLFCMTPEMTRALIDQLSESLKLLETMPENTTVIHKH